MRELPSGTVSLVFSDIEGSTLLLNRLGDAYSDALDVHRRILRQAWADVDGVELGTEGDSFFVVFRDAPDAVTATAQAQRDLDAYSWPAGERLRVRMGVHTGAPRVHDGGYVGMDVHRAARVAASAHGGQVVLSSVTAELARGDLPGGVALRDLGIHQLKDIPTPDQLWQLDIDGLPTDFPPLRTLGATSRLPMTATRLVGRDEEAATLTGLLRDPAARLVTLTGPGGSGKTRLAIGLAERLMVDFPDGVYFVPLAAVTSADVMWTSIAEAVDVPPRRRTPQGLFEYLADRRALLVLDNLEQLRDADDVVARLLTALPRAAVVATSRKALYVPGEYRHPVPTLELPHDSTFTPASTSSAVQLFVELAQRIEPRFRLTEGNAADVVDICRRLDGLPLAIELAASRIRVLSPQALLRRIDTALDIASVSRHTETRQRTLRDTIAWSYDLLAPREQSLFRRLGVFAGGADLEAIAAVTDDPATDESASDPLEIVAALVDVSLVAAAEGPDGEPRFTLLETLRRYARDELLAAGEAAGARGRHAQHFLAVSERLRLLRESQHLVARDQAEADLDNFREVLAWSLENAEGDAGASAEAVGLRLCAGLSWLWDTGGYAAEGLRWYEQVVALAQEQPSKELAACRSGMANLLLSQGKLEQARALALDGVTMARSVGDRETMAFALGVLGTAQQHSGDGEGARHTLEGAVDLYRDGGSSGRLGRTLGNLAGVEEMRGNFARSEELLQESLAIFRDLGDSHEATIQAQNLANLLVTSGRAEEAHRLARSLIHTVLALRNPNLTMAFSNTFMNILIERGEPRPAAHLFGAEQGMRERLGMPNPFEREELEEAWEAVGRQMPVDEWERERELGRRESLEDLLIELDVD